MSTYPRASALFCTGLGLLGALRKKSHIEFLEKTEFEANSLSKALFYRKFPKSLPQIFLPVYLHPYSLGPLLLCWPLSSHLLAARCPLYTPNRWPHQAHSCVAVVGMIPVCEPTRLHHRRINPGHVIVRRADGPQRSSHPRKFNGCYLPAMALRV